MLYLAILRFLDLILKFIENKEIIPETKKISYELNKTYRVFLTKNYLHYANEIDRTIEFFNAELVGINKRNFDKKTITVLTFLRKGFDTDTGKPYLHYEDILNSDIKTVELVG